MTTFLDGPAAHVMLTLQRAPLFLRVVAGGLLKDKWDALDQLDDHPAPTEALYAYRLAGKPGMCHVDRSRGRSSWYTIAQYAFVLEQPADEIMRDTKAWRVWCLAQTVPADVEVPQ